jgi:hypothetical protein
MNTIQRNQVSPVVLVHPALSWLAIHTNESFRTRTIAVGTAISGRPPHRSVRAELLHTAPTFDVDVRSVLQDTDGGYEGWGATSLGGPFEICRGICNCLVPRSIDTNRGRPTLAMILFLRYPHGFAFAVSRKCRYTLASSGEITAPCGVPTSVFVHCPSSETPALSHFFISRSMR